MAKIAIVGASGKLGSATISALITHKLASPSDIVALTSSTADSRTWAKLAETGAEVRHAHFDDTATFERALEGVDRFFLISTPHIALDFGVAMDHDGTVALPVGNGPPGRESQHKNAIDAAVRAGVKWIVYSSLAFGVSRDSGAMTMMMMMMDASKAGVMRAHLRTEAYLRAVSANHGIRVTILREGLYNESWPLYLGYFDAAHAGGERDVVPLAGDGRISWTAIHDLGVASALVISASSGTGVDEFAGKTFYLSTSPKTAKTMGDIARLVGEARGRKLQVAIVGRSEHERYYVEERGQPAPAVEWWVSTYAALEDGECLVDDPLLEKLLSGVGLKPIPVEQTIAAMVKG